MARKVFTEKGYYGTGTHEIVGLAKVTRGALAHYFPRKEDLFLAVFIEIQNDLLSHAAGAMNSNEGKDLWHVFLESLKGFLDAATQPEIQRILLLDGPAVLGWTEWRCLEEQYGLGVIEKSLEKIIDAGLMEPRPIPTLAKIILAIVDEAALQVANSTTPEKTKAEVEAIICDLLSSLT